MADKEQDTGTEKDSRLSNVRLKIDALDAKIQSLINDRARLASAVRESKGQLDNAVDYYRPEREAEVLRAVRERNPAGAAERDR